jgi:ribosomal-protein-alanine N-acetyltransferase
MSFLDRFRRTPPTARIEPLGTTHAARLSGIHETAFARAWGAFEFERLLADRSVLADGLFLGRSQTPAGFALSRRVADEAEILTLAMAPEARGQGHGRPLLLHHLDELARAGVRTVHLEVEESNAPALALYRRLGFRIVGRREGYYAKPDGSKVAALTMSATL